MRLLPFAFSMLVATSALADPLAAYRDEWRVVVASAARDDDPALLRQRALFEALDREAKNRDLVLVEAVGDGAEARAIRRALGLSGAAFAAALVGKDGETKLRAAHPLDAAALLPLIDSMPMRRRERRERGE